MLPSRSHIWFRMYNYSMMMLRYVFGQHIHSEDSSVCGRAFRMGLCTLRRPPELGVLLLIFEFRSAIASPHPRSGGSIHLPPCFRMANLGSTTEYLGMPYQHDGSKVFERFSTSTPCTTDVHLMLLSHQNTARSHIVKPEHEVFLPCFFLSDVTMFSGSSRCQGNGVMPRIILANFPINLAASHSVYATRTVRIRK